MLFEEIIYGPVRSRRLGVSLGVNLLPLHCKLCTFDCVYCECGFNTPVLHPQLPSRLEVAQALEEKLRNMCDHDEEGIRLDVITFSGNGEPTLHPDFERIIADTCRLRDRYCPSAKVSVLSNSTRLADPSVRRALMMVDNRILKLDSAVTSTLRLIDQPVNEALDAGQVIDLLSAFHGDFTLQTCFLRGDVLTPNPARDGHYLLGHIDNTTPAELAAWYAAVERLHPAHVMIYVIDRKTPVETLQKIPADKMHAIAGPLVDKGFDVTVSC